MCQSYLTLQFLMYIHTFPGWVLLRPKCFPHCISKSDFDLRTKSISLQKVFNLSGKCVLQWTYLPTGSVCQTYCVKSFCVEIFVYTNSNRANVNMCHIFSVFVFRFYCFGRSIVSKEKNGLSPFRKWDSNDKHKIQRNEIKQLVAAIPKKNRLFSFKTLS